MLVPYYFFVPRADSQACKWLLVTFVMLTNIYIGFG